jgi:hypothetical protein
MKRTPLKRRTPIRRTSRRRARDLKKYYELRQDFLTEYPVCQICAKERSTEIHHTRGRNGWRLLSIPTWLALCHWCHSKIHHQI